MRFPSARNNGERAYVLFFDQERYLAEDSPFTLINYEEVFFEKVKSFTVGAI